MEFSKRLFSFLTTSLLLSSTVWMQAEPIDFNRDVRPILSDRCFHCHGPDGGKRKAGLRLDIREDAQKLTDSGLAAIAPEHPDKSEVIVRILSTDPDELMPPPDRNHGLTPAEKETLQLWIREGAVYGEHWSFRHETNFDAIGHIEHRELDNWQHPRMHCHTELPEHGSVVT